MIQRKLISKTAQGETFVCSDGIILFRDNYGRERLKHTYVKKNYLQVDVRLEKTDKEKRYSVHRIVALNFIGAPTGDANQVNHKDGNKLNNHVDNLEWVTTRQNWRHAVEVLGVAPCNETYKICKETEEVLDIYESQAEAARKNNQNSVDRSLQGFNIKKPYLFIRKSEIDLLGISRCISDRIERSLKNSINKTEKKYSKERVEAIAHFFNKTNITYSDYSLITGIDRKLLSRMVRGKYF